jgi:glutaredoxin 2
MYEMRKKVEGVKMLSQEVLKVLESEWVQPTKDENGEETWGYELKLGAPDDVVIAFDEFLDASAAEAGLQGWNKAEVQEWNPRCK